MSYYDDKKWRKFLTEGNDLGSEYNIPLNISYGVYNVFQRYWEGQNDPLYAVLSRRGDSVDWATVEASQEEVDRMREVAEEIVSSSEDPMEKRTAQMQLDRIEDATPYSEYEQSLQQSYKGLNENALIDFAMLDYLWKNLKVPGVIDDYLAKRKNKGSGKSVNDKIDDWFKNNMSNPLVRGLYRALMMTGPNYGPNYADEYKKGTLKESEEKNEYAICTASVGKTAKAGTKRSEWTDAEEERYERCKEKVKNEEKLTSETLLNIVKEEIEIYNKELSDKQRGQGDGRTHSRRRTRS